MREKIDEFHPNKNLKTYLQAFHKEGYSEVKEKEGSLIPTK